VDLSELGRPYGGGGSRRRGQAVETGAVVAVGNPDGLAVVKAGGWGKAHRSGPFGMRLL